MTKDCEKMVRRRPQEDPNQDAPGHLDSYFVFGSFGTPFAQRDDQTWSEGGPKMVILWGQIRYIKRRCLRYLFLVNSGPGQPLEGNEKSQTTDSPKFVHPN